MPETRPRTPGPPPPSFTSHQLREARAEAASLAAKNERLTAALTAARRNRLQTSINLALGSALASIGLTIPAVALVCLIYDIDVMLGLDAKSMLLLGLSTFTVMLSLHYGKTNMLYGIVLLVNLAAYVFTVIVP